MIIRRIAECEFEIHHLRGKRIFSIDADEAKDVDDALSRSTTTAPTTLKFVADVSFVKKPNPPLDRDARKRASSDGDDPATHTRPLNPHLNIMTT